MGSLSLGQMIMTKLTSNHDDKPKSKLFKAILKSHLGFFSKTLGENYHKLMDEEAQQQLHDEKGPGHLSQWDLGHVRIPKALFHSL